MLKSIVIEGSVLINSFVSISLNRMFLYVLLTKQQQQISKSFKIPPIILHQVLEIKTALLVGLYEKVIFLQTWENSS
jgi:non-canonical (house-cleaning) NTP pyrophosphatase